MGVVVDLVAFLVAMAGAALAMGHVGYLAMLSRAARTRGTAGGATADYVAGRWWVAGGTAAVAVLGLALTTGPLPLDVLALLFGGGAGVVAKGALDSTRGTFRG